MPAGRPRVPCSGTWLAQLQRARLLVEVARDDAGKLVGIELARVGRHHVELGGVTAVFERPCPAVDDTARRVGAAQPDEEVGGRKDERGWPDVRHIAVAVICRLGVHACRGKAHDRCQRRRAGKNARHFADDCRETARRDDDVCLGAAGGKAANQFRDWRDDEFEVGIPGLPAFGVGIPVDDVNALAAEASLPVSVVTTARSRPPSCDRTTG